MPGACVSVMAFLLLHTRPPSLTTRTGISDGTRQRVSSHEREAIMQYERGQKSSSLHPILSPTSGVLAQVMGCTGFSTECVIGFCPLFCCYESISLLPCSTAEDGPGNTGSPSSRALSTTAPSQTAKVSSSHDVQTLFRTVQGF